MKAHILSVIVLITAGGLFPLFGQNINIIVTDICGGTSSGSITLEVIDGAESPFSIVWSNADTEEIITPNSEDVDLGTSEITNLESGTYCVEVISLMDGCSAESCELKVEELPPLQITKSISCICPNGFGAIEVDIAGGTPPYAQNWTDPNGNTITDLNVLQTLGMLGNYTLVVTDANGCQAMDIYNLEACSGDLYSANVVHSCDGPGTGSINVELLPIVQTPVFFIWTYQAPGEDEVTYNDITTTGLTSSAENLHGGTYCVTFFTNNGCSVNQCWDIVESQGIEEIQAGVQASTGLIALYNSDGVIFGDDYVYNWTGPDGLPVSTAPLFNADVSGIYHVIISHQNPMENPCQKELSVELFTCDGLENLSVLAPDSPDFPLSIDVFVAGSQKTLDLNLNELEGYQFGYEWTLDGNVVGNEQDLITEGAGEFCVTATERYCDNDISFTMCVDVCSFEAKFVSSFPQPDICNGVAMIADVNGGSGSFTYLWNDDNGSTDSYILMEYNREYCVTITDTEHDCSMIACRMIPHFNFNVSVTTTGTTLGGNDGSISLMTTGGFSGYSYQWEHPSLSGSSVTGLSGGDYVVTITDALDDGTICNTEVLTIHVDCVVPQQIVTDCVEANITPVDCGNSLGSIAIDETCITLAAELQYDPTYYYQWNHGPVTSSVDNLPVGEYCVTILEKNSGCSVFTCFDVPQADEANFDISISVLQGTCFGGDDAILRANVNGTGEYLYEWTVYAPNEDEEYEEMPFGNTAIVDGVSAGWYTVYVTDVNTGCQDYYQYLYWSSGSTIAVVGDISPNPNCDNSPTILTANVTGGDGPYIYEWFTSLPFQSIGTTTANNFTVTNSGDYYVIVTDANGCIGSESFEVIHSKVLDLNMEVEDICENVVTGSSYGGRIDVFIEGGTPPYVRTWNMIPAGSTNPNSTFYTSVSEGVYELTIEDALGCTATSTATVNSLNNIYSGIEITNVIYPNCSCCSTGGSIELNIGNNPNIPFTLVQTLSPSGEKIYYHNQTSTNIILDNLAVGYEHSFQVGYPDEPNSEDLSCKSLFSERILFEVSKPLTLTLDNQPPPPPNSQIEISVVGGTAPYTFLWSNGATTEDLMDIQEFGIYSVTVTDSGEGCTQTLSVDLSGCQFLDIELVSNSPACGETGAVLGFAGFAGTPPYTFEWTTIKNCELPNYIPISGTGTTTSSIPLDFCHNRINVTITDSEGCSATKEYPICSCDDEWHAFFDPRETVSCAGGAGAIKGLTIYTESNNFDIIHEIAPDGLQIEWTGPSGFTATGAIITNLSVAGTYCATIKGSCGEMELTRCLTLSCAGCTMNPQYSVDGCSANDNAGHLQITHVSPTNRFYFLEWSDGEKGVIRIGNESNNIDSSPLSPSIFLDSNIEDLIRYHKNSTFYGDYHIDLNKTGLPEGPFCATLTDMNGCKDLRCITVFAYSDCFYSFEENFPTSGIDSHCEAQEEIPFQEIREHEDFIALVGAGNFIGGCYDFDPCNDNSGPFDNSDHTKEGPILWVPSGLNSGNICDGGSLKCRLCSDEQLVVSTPNLVGTPFTIEGHCGCVFGPGQLIEPGFLNATQTANGFDDSDISDPFGLPIVAFFDCGSSLDLDCNFPDDEESPGGIPTGGGPTFTIDLNPDELCSAIETCDDCEFEVNEDHCTYEIYCAETGILEDETPALSFICWDDIDAVPNAACGIYRQCSINPCDLVLIDDCAGGNQNAFCSSYWLGQTGLEYGIPEFSVFQNGGPQNEDHICAEYNLAIVPSQNSYYYQCTCTEIASVIPKCFTCEGQNSLAPGIFEVASQADAEMYLKQFKAILGDKLEDTNTDKLTTKIHPNPFQNNFNLEVNVLKGSQVTIQILNLLGNNYFSEKYKVYSGRNNFNFNIDIPTGVYQVVVTDENGNFSTQRIVKTNN